MNGPKTISLIMMMTGPFQKADGWNQIGLHAAGDCRVPARTWAYELRDWIIATAWSR